MPKKVMYYCVCLHSPTSLTFHTFSRGTRGTWSAITASSQWRSRDSGSGRDTSSAREGMQNHIHPKRASCNIILFMVTL